MPHQQPRHAGWFIPMHEARVGSTPLHMQQSTSRYSIGLVSQPLKRSLPGACTPSCTYMPCALPAFPHTCTCSTGHRASHVPEPIIPGNVHRYCAAIEHGDVQPTAVALACRPLNKALGSVANRSASPPRSLYLLPQAYIHVLWRAQNGLQLPPVGICRVTPDGTFTCMHPPLMVAWRVELCVCVRARAHT